MSDLDLDGLAGMWEVRRRQFAALLDAFPAEELAWERTPVTVDEYGYVTVGRWGGYLLQIAQMLFNDRIILTPEADPLGYHHGWCYPRGYGAVLALAAWNPETEAEPGVYAKRATPGVRAAGERADR